MHRKTRAIAVCLMAFATIAPTVASVTPMVASAGQVLGETTFDHKALPWHTCETSPAKQEFAIEDGAFHITVIEPVGGESSKWDLQFRHRNLNFKAGHVYEVSFQAKSSRNGMELCSKIGNIKGDEEYFDLDGNNGNSFHMGPSMGGTINGGWGSPVKLTTSYQTFSGTFIPTQDLEGVEWAFHYAMDYNGYGGNAQAGDEIWFDNMSIICTTCDDCDADPNNSYGATNRDYSAADNPEMLVNGELVNYISVNQLGYYTNLAKVATLGDNQGDILYGASSITLSKNTYGFELIDASTGKTVYTGTSGTKFYDQDSHDNVCKLDFSDFTTPGTYYLKITGENWRSFEFEIGDDIYSDSSNDMLTNAINYFYQNRSGVDIQAAYITSYNEDDTTPNENGATGKAKLAHTGGHKTDTATVQKIWKNEYASKDEATGTYGSSQITASGGWYDAGDHGKYVVNGGISIWTLQNMYERAIQTAEGVAKFKDGSGTVVIPEAGNGVPDILDEAAVELDWIALMKVESNEPTWGKYAGLYYHKLHDHKWTGLATRPWNYEEEWDTVRIVKPPTFAATLNYAACAAQAARLWEPYDATKAAKYLSTAKEAYEAYKKYWYEAAADEEYNETSLYAPMLQAKGGGPYGDNEVRDDAYWAACEIYISAKEMGDSAASTYLTYLSEYENAFEVTSRITGGENASGEGSYTTFNWGNTASAGSLSLALHTDLLTAAQKATVEDSIIAVADEYIGTENAQGYGIPYLYDGPGYTDENNLPASVTIHGYEWGSNSMVINNLIVMAYAYDLSADTKYMNGVVTGMDYLLGNNPMSFSFITGYGSYCMNNPHHRYWSYELDKTLPMAPDGVLSGGPNAGLQDPYVRALGFVPGQEDVPSQRCYVDSIEAWSTNEVTINWNAPLAWIVSFMQDEASDASPSDDDDTTDWGNADCSEGDTPIERVTTADVVKMAKAQANLDTLSNQGVKNADVEPDGTVDNKDMKKILLYIAGLTPYEELGTLTMS